MNYGSRYSVMSILSSSWTEYRLVCRNWDYTTETFMFSKHIMFHFTNEARQLYRRLSKDADRGKLIKHLTTARSREDLHLVVRKLS